MALTPRIPDVAYRYRRKTLQPPMVPVCRINPEVKMVMEPMIAPTAGLRRRGSPTARVGLSFRFDWLEYGNAVEFDEYGRTAFLLGTHLLDLGSLFRLYAQNSINSQLLARELTLDVTFDSEDIVLLLLA